MTETVNIVYLGETEFMESKPKMVTEKDEDGMPVKMKKVFEVKKHVPAPKKKFKEWSSERHMMVTSEIIPKLNESDGKYYYHDVNLECAKVLDKSPNFEILDGEVPGSDSKEFEDTKATDDTKRWIRFVKPARVGRHDLSVGTERQFKVDFAQKFVDEGKAEFV